MTSQQKSAGPGEQHLPSGAQFDIRAGENRATIVEVGGGLRHCQLGGTEVLDGYAEQECCTGARGLPLVPWPNRIADGRYTFDGIDYQVPLTEPEAHNAIHGFLRWRNWVPVEHSETSVTMQSVLHPQMGYPFLLDVRVRYTVGDAGLTVETTARNIGTSPCPYGTGQHPYLQVGTGIIDPCRLQFDAATYLPTDERGLPTGRSTVRGSSYEFRAGREIGAQDIDLTFTDLARDADGLAWVRMAGPAGRGVALWADDHFPFIEIYTAHTQKPPHWRTGLGVEPMTCAPNAFQSGDGLIRLEPGESARTAWGLLGA